MRHLPGDFRPRRASLRIGLALAACTAWTGVAQAQYAARATLISPGDGSHPFNAVQFARVPQNLASVGYAEKEYFLSGLAKAYGYDSPGTPTNDSYAALQALPVPFVNRILVRAPSSPANFSGNVIVEVANDALISDNETQWPFANSQFTANGDAYILLTSSPTGLDTLKAYAAARYRSLSWPTLAATKSCSGGQPETGIIYDQITELGNLLRAGSSTSPLSGYAVRHLFLTGYSGAASTLLTYDRVFALNSTLWDAYLIAAGGFRAALNDCEASGVAGAHNAPPASTRAAIFQTQTESELYLASAESVTVPHAADSNATNNRYRYYEIAGTSHVNGDLLAHSPQRSDFPVIPGVDYLADVTEAGLKSECTGVTSTGAGSTAVFSAFPNRYVYDALWANLEHWVASGVAYAPPTEASAITNTDVFTYGGLTAPTGGVRSPAVDVQLENYPAGSLPPSGSAALQTFCALTGTQQAATGTVNAAKVMADAASLHAAGFLTSADQAIINANPLLAYTFPNGTTSVPN